MTFPDTPRHVEIRNGGQIVAAAEVSMPAGTARTSLHAAAGHVTRLARATWSTPSWICPRCGPASG